jgi:hypothetical protein
MLSRPGISFTQQWFLLKNRGVAHRGLCGSVLWTGSVRIDSKQSFAMINGAGRGITAVFKREVKRLKRR